MIADVSVQILLSQMFSMLLDKNHDSVEGNWRSELLVQLLYGGLNCVISEERWSRIDSATVLTVDRYSKYFLTTFGMRHSDRETFRGCVSFISRWQTQPLLFCKKITAHR